MRSTWESQTKRLSAGLPREQTRFRFQSTRPNCLGLARLRATDLQSSPTTPAISLGTLSTEPGSGIVLTLSGDPFVGGAIAANPLPVDGWYQEGTVLTQGNLTLSWDPTASGYTLESTESLRSPIQWTPVVGVGSGHVTVPVDGSGRFYRLRR